MITHRWIMENYPIIFIVGEGIDCALSSSIVSIEIVEEMGENKINKTAK